MRLIELEPRWLQYRREQVEPNVWIDNVMHPDGIRTALHTVETLADAHGISFLCPKCFAGDHHSVICWFEGKVPDDAQPVPGRWNPIGSGFDDLSFVPGAKSNSVLLLGGCAWHGFITNGEATLS
jgi:hypothetical protein